MILIDKCRAYYVRPKTIYLDPATVAYITGKWPENDGKVEAEVGECWGTKEKEECSCGGDRSKCNFYPHIKEKLNEESATSLNYVYTTGYNHIGIVRSDNEKNARDGVYKSIGEYPTSLSNIDDLDYDNFGVADLEM